MLLSKASETHPEGADGGHREVAEMAWPLAVGMLSFTVMGVVDTLLMGHVSTPAQAGVGLATMFAWGFIAFFRGLTTGAQSVVAAADGAGDRDRVERAGAAGWLMGLSSGAVAAGGLLLVTVLGLHHLVDDPNIAGPAREYLLVRTAGVPFTLISFGLLAGLQGLGDMRTRMWVSVVGNGVNIGLDLVLIFGLGPIPALGATGAAIATVASSITMAALYARRHRRLFGPPRRPGWSALHASLTVGLPAGMQSLLGASAFTVVTVVLARAGAVDLAAHEIVLNIISLSFLPGFGVGEAGGVLVGRYLGAGRRPTAMRALRSARGLALVLMGVCGVLFLFAGEPVARLFNPDPAVSRLAGELLLFAAAFQLFDAVATVHLCALRGAGDTRFTLLLTSSASWLLTVPAAAGLGLYLGWGARGAWLGLTIELAVLAGVTGWRVTGLASGRVGRMALLLGRSGS